MIVIAWTFWRKLQLDIPKGITANEMIIYKYVYLYD